jgi:hypothetical protein
MEWRVKNVDFGCFCENAHVWFVMILWDFVLEFLYEGKVG